METEEHVRRRGEAAEQFNRNAGRTDGARIATSLAEGLTVLRDSLYRRVHEDVQRAVGMDSMLAPISEEKAEKLAKTEIELYQVAVSVGTARDCGYVQDDDGWYLQWLTRLRLGKIYGEPKVRQRLENYLSKSADGRRLTFTNVLACALPESRRAPLVLFRLVPLAVQIATSLAFADHANASDVRNRQTTYLPAIGDCRECRGKLLENGELCRECGNPLWKFDWLVSSD